MKFDVLESLLNIIYELIDVVCKFLLRFFIVYVYNVTDKTQRALMEYLATSYWCRFWIPYVTGGLVADYNIEVCIFTFANIFE